MKNRNSWTSCLKEYVYIRPEMHSWGTAKTETSQSQLVEKRLTADTR